MVQLGIEARILLSCAKKMDRSFFALEYGLNVVQKYNLDIVLRTY
jgi:hypothetical protein